MPTTTRTAGQWKCCGDRWVAEGKQCARCGSTHPWRPPDAAKAFVEHGAPEESEESEAAAVSIRRGETMEWEWQCCGDRWVDEGMPCSECWATQRLSPNGQWRKKSDETKWRCPTCSLKNDNTVYACEKCTTPRVLPGPAPVDPEDGDRQGAEWLSINEHQSVLVGSLAHRDWLATQADTEKVDHPQHYSAGKFECIDVIEELGLGFNLGNAFKYLWRCGRKYGALADLQKARWYLDREIERRQPDAD